MYILLRLLTRVGTLPDHYSNLLRWSSHVKNWAEQELIISQLLKGVEIQVL